MGTVLCMYSGGKDSTLAALKRALSGDSVRLLVFDTGTLVDYRNILYNAHAICNAFPDKIKLEGIRSTYSTHQRICSFWYQSTLANLACKYDKLTYAQVQCFHCQLSMWVEAIAWAKSHSIAAICCGYKQCDKYCTGSAYFTDAMIDLALKYDVNAMYPTTYETYIDDLQLAGCGVNLLHPDLKCTAGVRVCDKLSSEEEKQLILYYNDVLKSKCIHRIDKLLTIFKEMKLSDTPFY